MNSGVSLLAKTAFFNDVTITSSLRSVVQVLIGHFTILVTRIVRMISAKNYEKLSKFVKVTAKILSVPFFPDTVLQSACIVLLTIGLLYRLPYILYIDLIQFSTVWI